MKKTGRWLWMLMAVATIACAREPQISVQDAWARAVPPVSKNSAGYLVIENRGDQEDALVAVRVGKVRVTELHEMVRDGDSMSMQRRKEIPVPAHGRAVLAPGGLHLMLIDLQQPLHAGEKLDAVLRFRNAGEVKVVMEVRAP
jgi:hypothetical protein